MVDEAIPVKNGGDKGGVAAQQDAMQTLLVRMNLQEQHVLIGHHVLNMNLFQRKVQQK